MGAALTIIGWVILIIGWVCLIKAGRLTANNKDNLVICEQEVKADELSKFGGSLCFLAFIVFMCNLIFVL